MNPRSIMLIAGEPSGDQLAANLVRALRGRVTQSGNGNRDPHGNRFAPEYFGAGGPHMAEAGVEVLEDMTRHSVIGLSDALRKYFQFKRIFRRLVRHAIEREPDMIIGIDFFGFNGRFAHAIQRRVRSQRGPFHNWRPRLVQYVSPQVWASRPGRARIMEQDYDLVLSIFPFETEWYARQAPSLQVEFVGNPLADRVRHPQALSNGTEAEAGADQPPMVVLLPGSRPAEIRRHTPVILDAANRIHEALRTRFLMVVPSQELADQLFQMEEVRQMHAFRDLVRVQVGGLTEALPGATIAISKTGTVTMECACFGVPTVAFYKTSWSTYQIGRRIVSVQHLAMPNILAGETVFPEFIQHEATGANLANAALELLRNRDRRSRIKTKLAAITGALGRPGAGMRAAEAILKLMR